jgi:hypothetical protein
MRRKAVVTMLVVIGGLAVGAGIAAADGEPADGWLPASGGIIRAEEMPSVLPLAGPSGDVMGYVPNPALYEVPFPPPSNLVFRTKTEATTAVVRGAVSRSR